jgi:hypothetical protein
MTPLLILTRGQLLPDCSSHSFETIEASSSFGAPTLAFFMAHTILFVDGSRIKVLKNRGGEFNLGAEISSEQALKVLQPGMLFNLQLPTRGQISDIRDWSLKAPVVAGYTHRSGSEEVETCP